MDHSSSCSAGAVWRSLAGRWVCGGADGAGRAGTRKGCNKLIKPQDRECRGDCAGARGRALAINVP